MNAAQSAQNCDKWALDEVGAAVSRQKLAEALWEHGFYDVVEHGISVFKNIRLHDEDSEKTGIPQSSLVKNL